MLYVLRYFFRLHVSGAAPWSFWTCWRDANCCAASPAAPSSKLQAGRIASCANYNRSALVVLRYLTQKYRGSGNAALVAQRCTREKGVEERRGDVDRGVHGSGARDVDRGVHDTNPEGTLDPCVTWDRETHGRALAEGEQAVDAASVMTSLCTIGDCKPTVTTGACETTPVGGVGDADPACARGRGTACGSRR